jgi:hypothetical protein
MDVIKYLFKKIIIIMHVLIIQEYINLVQLVAYGLNVGHVVKGNGEVKDVKKGSIGEYY